jgi:hypothetical protein
MVDLEIAKTINTTTGIRAWKAILLVKAAGRNVEVS